MPRQLRRHIDRFQLAAGTEVDRRSSDHGSNHHPFQRFNPGHDDHGDDLLRHCIKTEVHGEPLLAALEDKRVHGLALEAGVPLVTVSRILGHHSPEFTATQYIHVSERGLVTAADTLQSYLQQAAIRPAINPAIAACQSA